MLLAIDTSAVFAGLACYNEQGLLAETVWQSGRNHTRQILPQLDLLLRHLGKKPSAIQAVAVALGPGSWSSLRVGLSLGKGIALAQNLPILGIGTLEALAFQHRRPDMPVYPLARLGRDQFATAEFQPGDQWKILSDYQNLNLANLCQRITGPAFFCGDLDPETQARIQQLLGDQAFFPSPVANLRRPGYLATLAWERLQKGEIDDLAQVEPIYLGNPIRGKS